MIPFQYVRRLVLFLFITKVTSRPTPYGSHLINFLGDSTGDRTIGCGNCDNNRHHNQDNFGTGSDSSLVEISFQPLREFESVSSPLSSSYHFFPLAGKQFLSQNLPPRVPVFSTTQNHYSRKFHRPRRTHYRLVEQQNQPYPDEPLNQIQTTKTTLSLSPVVNGLNEIFYPEEVESDFGSRNPFDVVRHDIQSNNVDISEPVEGWEGGWNVFKRVAYPHSIYFENGLPFLGLEENLSSNKRNALAAFKRQKFKTHQTQFVPSLSAGSMTSLGAFFKKLKNSMHFVERGHFSGSAEELLEGDHPINMLREELKTDGTKPPRTSAFLHAIRTFRPSQRIRSLVALNPEGYHGSQFLDPNYMWIGLGK